MKIQNIFKIKLKNPKNCIQRNIENSKNQLKNVIKEQKLKIRKNTEFRKNTKNIGRILEALKMTHH